MPPKSPHRLHRGAQEVHAAPAGSERCDRYLRTVMTPDEARTRTRTLERCRRCSRRGCRARALAGHQRRVVAVLQPAQQVETRLSCLGLARRRRNPTRESSRPLVPAEVDTASATPTKPQDYYVVGAAHYSGARRRSDYLSGPPRMADFDKRLRFDDGRDEGSSCGYDADDHSFFIVTYREVKLSQRRSPSEYRRFSAWFAVARGDPGPRLAGGRGQRAERAARQDRRGTLHRVEAGDAGHVLRVPHQMIVGRQEAPRSIDAESGALEAPRIAGVPVVGRGAPAEHEQKPKTRTNEYYSAVEDSSRTITRFT